MRKLVVVTSATLALAAGFVLAQPFSPAGAGGGTDISFTEKLTEFTTLDLGETGISQGDRDVYESELVDDDGKVIGTGGGECTSIVPKKDGLGLTNCVAYWDLAGGQLLYGGLYDLAQPGGTMAVTGGTGDYAGAKGTTDFKKVDDTTFPTEVHLID